MASAVLHFIAGGVNTVAWMCITDENDLKSLKKRIEDAKRCTKRYKYAEERLKAEIVQEALEKKC